MTVYIPTIYLEKEPSRIIEWFTKNYEHEIGAFGTTRIDNGVVVVDKLYFPTQLVGSAHVHFKPEDWASVLSECPQEDIGRILFYWHKHPSGFCTPSQCDEDNTFDVLMPEDSEKPYFVFLITAKGTSGSLLHYGRIDIRSPVVATYEKCELKVIDDSVTEEMCQKILSEKIKVGNAGTNDQPGVEGKPVIPVSGTYKEPDNYQDDFYSDIFMTVEEDSPGENDKIKDILVTTNDYMIYDLYNKLEEMGTKVDYYFSSQEKANIGASMLYVTPKEGCFEEVLKELEDYATTITEIGSATEFSSNKYFYG